MHPTEAPAEPTPGDSDDEREAGRSGGVNIAGDAEVGGDVVGRDKIVIGEGARNVAIGRHVIQIGKIVVPARLIFALVAVVAVFAVAAWLAFVPAQMPLNTFNIAVAEFGQLGAQGRLSGSADGSNLSRWIFGQLRDEALRLPADRRIVVWHDSLGLLEKRATIGIVPGATAAAREQAARALAKSLNAHVVIYGTLAVDQNPNTFTPEFFVAELSGEADELLGGQQLGSPIPVQPPIDFNRQVTGEYFNRALKPRAEALIWFTRGLTYDLSGQHDKALEVFRQAEAQLTDWQGGACVNGRVADSQGKEVLYYFIGREALFLARSEDEARRAFDSADEALAAAEQAFQQALDVRCDYARAHFGLGNVHLQRALRVLIARQFDADSLARARADADRAIEQDTIALQTASASPGSGIEVKARVALGMAYLIKGQASAAGGDHAEAVSLFQSAVGEIEAALPSIAADDYRFRAQTYQSLAGAYYARGHSHLALGERDASRSSFEAAIGFYDQCIAQADANIYDSFLQGIKTGLCAPQRDEAAGALARLDAGP